jgi:hypothetical protein
MVLDATARLGHHVITNTFQIITGQENVVLNVKRVLPESIMQFPS